MPVHHAKLIIHVPAIGMQFANDLDYLGFQLATLVETTSSVAIAWNESRRKDVKKTLHAMSTLASLERSRQVVRTRVLLFTKSIN